MLKSYNPLANCEFIENFYALYLSIVKGYTVNEAFDKVRELETMNPQA